MSHPQEVCLLRHAPTSPALRTHLADRGEMAFCRGLLTPAKRRGYGRPALVGGMLARELICTTVPVCGAWMMLPPPM
jgi:hypothetical protein